jgi:sugar fermentation stimulation protein A
MQYQGVMQIGTFVVRPNRFVAHVVVNGNLVIAHVKNTGRCRELLIEGVGVILEYAPHPNRKTDYSLVAVYKGEELVNIDSQAPNAVVKEALSMGLIQGFDHLTWIKAEAQYKKSRFDFYVETERRKIFIEAKGVTLEEDGIVRFPDAPTERGTKHVYELIDAIENGYEATILFVIQLSKAKWFEPNAIMDPEFSIALKLAKEKGVQIQAYTCHVTVGGMKIGERVEVRV